MSGCFHYRHKYLGSTKKRFQRTKNKTKEKFLKEDGKHLQPLSNQIVRNVEKQRSNAKTQKLTQLSQLLREIRQYRVTTDDLLRIFPEEIWIMILDCVEVENKPNCATAFPLFKKLMGGIPYFAEAFPSLIPYLNYENTENCMKAFPEWRLGILHHIEKHVSNPDQLVEHETPFEGQFKFQKLNLSPILLQRYKLVNTFGLKIEKTQQEQFRDLYQHSTVFVEASSDPEFNSKFEKFLEKRGPKLLHLTLKRAQGLDSVCQLILHKCKNLKSLTLDKLGFSSRYVSPTERLESVVSMPPLNDHSCLESLTIDLEFKSSWIFANFFVSKYAKQLKVVNVYFGDIKFYQIYSKLQFDSLTEFHAVWGNKTAVLSLLEKITLPNLQKFVLQLENNAPDLNQLINVLARFPKLTLVDMKLTESFAGWTNSDILTVLPKKCVNNAVQILNVTLQGSEFCLDFLICFPHLKQLNIVYEEIEDKNKVCDECAEDLQKSCIEAHQVVGFENSNGSLSLGMASTLNQLEQDIASNFEFVPKNEPNTRDAKRASTKDLLYLKSGKEIYTSKIRKALPYIKTIQFPGNDLVYTREKFDWLRLPYAVKVNTVLKNVRAEAQRRNSEKAQKLRKKFQSDSQVIAENRAIRKSAAFTTKKNTQDQQSFYKAFPFVFVHLSKTDLLLCRTICNEWCKIVDISLELTPNSVKPGLRVFWYVLRIAENAEPLPDDLLQHTRNPFISRSLHIVVGVIKQNPRLATIVSAFKGIQSITKDVYNLKVSFEEKVEMTSDDYFFLSELLLQTFSNLRSLELGTVKVDWGTHNKLRVDSISLPSVLPPVRTLRLMCSTNILHIHVKLVEIFCPNLKHLFVDWYGDEYCQGISPFSGNEALEDIVVPYTWRVEFPKMLNLKRLGVDLREHNEKLKYWSTFENILESPINTLELTASTKFSGFHIDSLFRANAAKISSCTYLILTVENTNTFLFDILVLFPYLKRLEIRYGAWINHWMFQLIDNVNDKRRNNQSERTTANNTKYLLDLKSSLGKDIAEAKLNISNVWTLLPTLEFIKLVNGTSSRDTTISKVFTRENSESVVNIV